MERREERKEKGKEASVLCSICEMQVLGFTNRAASPTIAANVRMKTTQYHILL